MMQESGFARLTIPVSQSDHRQGPLTAPVKLVEYGDYECPYCGMAHPIVNEMKRRLKDQLCFVYRHFPLTQIHPHAEHAAEAAEAAGAQGKFWQMHSMLFEHQKALDDAHLVVYAARLQLDTERFERELAEHLYVVRVNEDFMGGVRSGVNGTPTFFINGIRYDGPQDLETLLATIQEAMVL